MLDWCQLSCVWKAFRKHLNELSNKFFIVKFDWLWGLYTEEGGAWSASWAPRLWSWLSIVHLNVSLQLQQNGTVHDVHTTNALSHDCNVHGNVCTWSTDIWEDPEMKKTKQKPMQKSLRGSVQEWLEAWLQRIERKNGFSCRSPRGQQYTESRGWRGIKKKRLQSCRSTATEDDKSVS